MPKFLVILLAVALGLSACKNYKAEHDKMLEENAALQKKVNDMSSEGKLIRGEYSEAIETLNAIEDSLRAITDREKDIQKLSQNLEMSKDLSQKQAILSKLQALKNANDKAKDNAKQLQAKLNGYRVENEQLRKMIAQAETKILAKEQELEVSQGIIDGLRDGLGKMEAQLLESQGELATAYEDLKRKNADLEATNERLNRTLDELRQKTVFIEEQAKGYVACGSKKVLRQKGILSRSSMKLTKEYQTAVRANSSSIDYYESDNVECGTEGQIIAVLPERPSTSYQINGHKLIVKDTEEFWKTDKIVVLIKD